MLMFQYCPRCRSDKASMNKKLLNLQKDRYTVQSAAFASDPAFIIHDRCLGQRGGIELEHGTELWSLKINFFDASKISLREAKWTSI